MEVDTVVAELAMFEEMTWWPVSAAYPIGVGSCVELIGQSMPVFANPRPIEDITGALDIMAFGMRHKGGSRIP